MITRTQRDRFNERMGEWRKKEETSENWIRRTDWMAGGAAVASSGKWRLVVVYPSNKKGEIIIIIIVKTQDRWSSAEQVGSVVFEERLLLLLEGKLTNLKTLLQGIHLLACRLSCLGGVPRTWNIVQLLRDPDCKRSQKEEPGKLQKRPLRS